MFREMRRARQQLSDSESFAILERGRYGTLALLGDDGYPYAVPLNYVLWDGWIYFHSAKQGHKIDAVCREPKASFCVVDSDELVPQEYTTYFRSVIVFGQVHIVTDDEEKRGAITELAKKYNPSDSEQHRNAAIDKEYSPLCMLRMEIEHISGKEAIELVRQRSRYNISLAESAEMLSSCLAVRTDVFVRERGVSADIERDEHDILGGMCEHFLISDNGVPVGAFRCMRKGEAAVLQRFCVLREYRGKGAGAAALRYMESYYRDKGMQRIELDSKAEAEGFYSRCGYVRISEPFEEAGIPHVKMVKVL